MQQPARRVLLVAGVILLAACAASATGITRKERSENTRKERSENTRKERSENTRKERSENTPKERSQNSPACRDCNCIKQPRCTVDCASGAYILQFDQCGPVGWAGCLKYNSLTKSDKSPCQLARCGGKLAQHSQGGKYCDACKAGASFYIPKSARYAEVYVQSEDFYGTDCGSKRFGACGCGGATSGRCGRGGVSSGLAD
eukprot:jgi/Chrzof1/13287/Cz07g27180.t1